MKKDNDYSIAVLVEHGSVNLFFAGDAQKQRLQELEQREFPDIDLYKVAYHGRDSSHSAQLIRQIEPRLAVVTAKEPLGENCGCLKRGFSPGFVHLRSGLFYGKQWRYFGMETPIGL